ncbi:hypothetical protein [Aliiroseovarius sp. F47248L]|nr:hypothetical protein [Aliiroseovarius sp. F47248L]MCK0138829.1 hypothetical protein [Aliiroseovarius sp. F47248L]
MPKAPTDLNLRHRRMDRYWSSLDFRTARRATVLAPTRHGRVTAATA